MNSLEKRVLTKRILPLLLVIVLALGATFGVLSQTDTPQPDSVVLVGSLQTALGCEADDDAACELSALTYDKANDIWRASFEVPAGEYDYQAALDGALDEVYGADATADGEPIALALESDTVVEFYYDHKTNWITDNVNFPIVVAVGTFQTELGCEEDYDAACLRSWLQDTSGNGVFSLTLTDLPPGDYEVMVATDRTDSLMGAMGVVDGDPVAFTVGENFEVTIGYSARRGLVSAAARDPQAVVEPMPTREVRPVTGIITAPGSYQMFLGCDDTTGNRGNWEPGCLESQLFDEDGDNVYQLVVDSIPAGSYEMKIAVDRAWSENYGLGGARDGSNVPFEVPVDYAQVMFEFDAITREISISVDESIIGGPLEIEFGVSLPDLTFQQAYWVTRDTILIDPTRLPQDVGVFVKLYYSPTADLTPDETGFVGGESIDLSFSPEIPQSVLDKFPHLSGFTAYTIDEAHLELVPDILRGQFAVAAVGEDGNAFYGTGLQIPGVLDDLYATTARLGVTFNDDAPILRVWAPTAQNVRLHIFDDSDPDTESTVYDMFRVDRSGVWTITGSPDWYGKYYLYEVTVYAPAVTDIVTNLVTDPYSVSLAMNSTRSQIIDLANDPDLMPDGWDSVSKPPLDSPTDIVVYELHVRDFSVNDPSASDDNRGTFMAFTETESNGMQHLAALAEAGLSHLHLLPTFDIATINENPDERVELDFEELAQFPPDSEDQQALLEPIRDMDAFNWGYDPYHFNVPEGSYSTDPDGPARIREFREMVMALNENGLRLVIDVVYNHTNAAGQADRSVFDRIVPGYYHRLNQNGFVETSTCCPNTATEHVMMERFMLDSVVLWARDYKVDGFRFDLMGHHMLDNMANVRDALDALTLETDGVDGESIYVYGEGWNFGEVQDNARGVNATQLNIGGLGIGTFNDRLRDAVRGGSPFGDRTFQGFISDLSLNPNGLTGGTEAQQAERMALFMDQIRIGLAGNLRDYTFVGSAGDEITGADVSYGGSPAGYTLSPAEHIVYISKHDNETLWDILLYKQLDVPVEELVRMHNLGNSIVMFSQGVPFFHAGDDMLRSKSLDRNSYNSGDWFNRLDFTYQTNNFGVGLPPASDNADRWDEMRPILANPDLQVGEAEIMSAVEHFREILRIRQGSPLFRLETAEQVQERQTFLNTGPDQQPGVIVMALSDEVGEQLDDNYAMIVTIFNATGDEYTFSDDSLAGMAFELHPILAESSDPVVREAAFADDTFTVPGRTAAVFVVPR